MTSVAEARGAMLSVVPPLDSEVVALTAARDRVLAAPVVASRAQPPFAASAMDGFALRSEDTPGRLSVVGESAAGRAYARTLARGQAVRISTGAPMPAGADTVLIQEEARLERDALSADYVASCKHVRRAGLDFGAGAEVLSKGRRLDPIALALAAAAGAATMCVHRRPRVSILCGGDEIVPAGATPRSDQIFESCSYAIAGFVEAWGAQVKRFDPLPDDPAIIERAAAAALSDSDLVVFIGAASVGPHDHAKPAFQKLGARVLVQKVDMRPGKPTWFAETPHAPVLGLPGNPASAVVAAVLFLRPLIERMLGRSGDVPIAHAKLTAPLPANGPREAYLRARVHSGEDGESVVHVGDDQDSSLLTVLDRANVLLRRVAHESARNAGDIAECIALSGV